MTETSVLGERLTIATFNCEWRRTASADAKLIVERLFHHDPDVVCLTECHADYLCRDGHVICSELFDPVRASRRKVLLWSRQPWSVAEYADACGLPAGRFVQGTTLTQLGYLAFAGVVIPYRMAEVRTLGRKPWELHRSYLEGLHRHLPPTPRSTVLLGDFNQRLPRKWQPIAIHAALDNVVSDRFSTTTDGVIEPIGRQSIDHICVSDDLQGHEVESISNIGPGGRKISDHFGVSVQISKVGMHR